MKLVELIAAARSITESPARQYTERVRNFARDVLAYHESHASKLRAELVAWAVRWRNETCDQLTNCDHYDDSHDEQCQVWRNRIDGIALVDALAIAEKEPA